MERNPEKCYNERKHGKKIIENIEMNMVKEI